jgi:hypothetical protein
MGRDEPWSKSGRLDVRCIGVTLEPDDASGADASVRKAMKQVAYGQSAL